jgi:hypothetical protein
VLVDGLLGAGFEPWMGPDACALACFVVGRLPWALRLGTVRQGFWVSDLAASAKEGLGGLGR